MYNKFTFKLNEDKDVVNCFVIDVDKTQYLCNIRFNLK